MAELSIQSAVKTYPNGFQAVKGISLDARDGEFVVLVGPSGCGKSTLLRMIAGLEDITDGVIEIGGRKVNQVDPAERDIAMVFQNYALYPHMSVYQNLAYGLKNRRMPKAEIETRVQEAARILEITALLDRKPRQLSGGQRQRVAMGRAIVREPSVFLFDEPLSNLDAKLRAQMRVEIKKLQHTLGVTSVYVTHDQLEAMTLADKLVVLNQGVVEQMGPPLEVYRAPASIFVAQFIGAPAMNILPAVQDGGGLAHEHGAAMSGPRLHDAGRVWLGLRPEDIVLEKPEGDAIRIELEIDAIEPVGAETIVHGRLKDIADKGEVIVSVSAEEALDEGKPLTVYARPDRAHLFDRESGRRLAHAGYAAHSEATPAVRQAVAAEQA